MNKRERKNGPGFSNFGFSTILLAFVMICIVTISALSLLTANSDYKLSQKVAEKNTAYYEAEKQAYETLADVDALLATAYAQTSNKTDYYKAVGTALQTTDIGTYDPAHASYSYEVAISDTQSLKIVLLVQYPENANDSFYQIDTWQSVYDEMEYTEGTLDLID